jgi:WD40 repeat protein
MKELVGRNLGRYEIVARLGQGGMADVYKAYQPSLDRHVAVKVLHSRLAEEEGGFVERFEREAAAVARLRHPNIVQIYDFDFEVDGDLYYMVMEFIEGPTLWAELQERVTQGRLFSLDDTVRIFNALAGAIDYAHSRGTIHRDLKPANVMFTAEGQVVLTDFGIAHIIGAGHHTTAGVVLGTPAYMSPEQGQGQPVDERSDIYGLGVMLYEMVTGRVPFEAETPMSVILKHVTEPVLSPTAVNPGVPGAVEQVILKAMSKEPCNRYGTAGEMARALREAAGMATDQLLAAVPVVTIALGPHSEDTTPLELARPPVLPSPYRGLLAFREKDAPLFFGREVFTDRLVEAVDERSLVVLLGPSGSGKSSVVFAGLVPYLRQGAALRGGQGRAWMAADLRPGDRPFHALADALVPLLEADVSETDRLIETRKLAEALGQGDVLLCDVAERVLDKQPQAGRLLLVIDQFEELYTLCSEPELRQRFVDALLGAVGGRPDQREPSFVLILTLRADFLGPAMAHRPFADSLQDAGLILGPMTRQELSEAIENPARKLGVAAEAGLVERILDDVGEEPGNLPLLEFALTQLWERREGGWLTHAAYEAIGRVEGALAHYADEVYSRLSGTERDQARRVFVQLVRPGEGTEDTRRVAARAELGEVGWELVQELADARLVVTDRDPAGQEVVEVAHEALIRGWGRLRAWMDEDRAFRVWQERLRAALRQWDVSGRDEGALLRGVPLAEAEQWQVERADNLNPDERAYIMKSVALRGQEQAARERTRRRLTLAAVAAAVVFLILAVLGGAGWRQAERRRQEAEVQHRVALSRQLAALSANQLKDFNWEVAMLLAVEAGRTADTAEAFTALRHAFAFPGRTLRILSGHTLGINQAVWNSDESRILTASRDGTARVWETDTGAGLLILVGHTGGVLKAVWNPDEDRILTAGVDGTARVWDVETGGALLTLSGHAGSVVQASWNFDGSRILTAGDDGTARVWDAETGVELLTLSGHTDDVSQAVWNSDGSRILTASYDGTACVWDVATALDTGAHTGAKLITLSGHQGSIYQAMWNSDGSRILTASNDGTARVWDAETRAEMLTLFGHESGVLRAMWNKDESRILTASYDNTARVWDAETGAKLFTLSGHTHIVRQAVWDSSGRYILTASRDGTARVWDAETGAELVTLSGHTGGVAQAVWNGDGGRVLTASGNGVVRVWDLQAGAELVTLSGHKDKVEKAVWNSDGSRILTSSSDNRARMWDAETGAKLITFSGRMGMWSADGSRVLTVRRDGTACAWDAETGSQLVTFSGYTESATDSVWNTDGSRILTDRGDGIVRVGDLQTGAELVTLSGHMAGVVQAVWNTDGSRILTASSDKTARVWDVETGTELVTLSGHTGQVLQAGWNGDESRILTASSDRTARVWDVEAGVALITLSGHEGIVLQAAWNSDESRILTASADGTARVWDAETGTELAILFGHTDALYQAMWNADGDRILTASRDGTARVWDAETGAELMVLFGHTGEVVNATWNPDETRILTASDDRTARLWYTRMEDLLQAACQSAPRDMTEEEWRRFMGDEAYRETCPGKLVLSE